MKLKQHPILASLVALPTLAMAQTENRPNIIILNIDDMGFSDPACFGGDYAPTPNIDRLADEGLRFTQFYTSCPISSPSRTGLTTGMYPTRWGINTYLQERANNAKNEQNDFLSSRAPSMARALKQSGYTTGHFGKWHMGGGRDVKNAPKIPTYGFDEWASTWESPNPDPKLTSSNWIWAATDEVKRWDRTAYFVDKTLDFLKRHKGEPCFVNLWPDDVHTPWVYENDESSKRESAASFAIVLKELDVQIGRLMDGLRELGIDDNTILIFTSDNGPAPAFDGHRTNSLRGQKGTLYEGGIRMPFIIRWPGKIPAGVTNSTSVLCTVDLFPSLCNIANASVPTDFKLDGTDVSEILLGKSQASRTTPLFWQFGKCNANRVSPHIAVRDGKWKLLVNADGTRTELYNMEKDANEQQNVALSNPDVVNRLKPAAIEWYNEAYNEYANNIIRVAVDGDALADGTTWEKATTLAHAIQLGAVESGSQLWLKAGTYSVTSSVNVDNIGLYGGFSGNEQHLNERNWAEHPSIIDGGGKVSPLRNQTLDASVSTVIDGLVVQNGLNQQGTNGNGNGGAAILTNGAVVRNCIFRNNKTQNNKNGAAIHCHSGQVRIENSLFTDNTSTGNGGAIQVGGGVTATVINCTIADNTATGPGGAFGLGAESSNLNVYNTLAWNNTGKGARSSYGQNTNINGGGTVISKYSAIESTSTKFTDGDDISHISLTETLTPQFVEGEYQLNETSPCIDAGNANLLAETERDLAGERRLSGRQIDIGAYEFDNGLPIGTEYVVHVAVDGDAKSDGSSWEKATTLANAIQLVKTYSNTAVLWLKEGTYSLTSSINPDNMEIYGGFCGNEKDINERNWAEHPSILDGGDKVSPLRNQTLDASVSTVIDGLVVQNGLNQQGANGNGNGGGAILTNGAVVRNCILRNNKTQNSKNGAAIHCHLGQVRIENSLFTGNTSTGNGGAIQVGGGVTVTIVNCTIADNTATGPGGAFGLGNNMSNLNVYNTLAWNNTGKGARSSFGQNTNVNGGGTVISRYSAIESASTKFTDGDDEGHIALSKTNNPRLSDTYQLLEGSCCIDTGDDDYAAILTRDLAGNARIRGLHVDIGAYEADSETAIRKQTSDARLSCTNDELIITGGIPNEVLSIFATDGTLVHRQVMQFKTVSIPWSLRGVYFAQIGQHTIKFSSSSKNL